MSKTIKEPATYAQQIEKLRQRGICMSDDCQSFLSRVNYYRLSGYILPLPPDRTLYTQLYMLKLMYPDRTEWNTRFYEPLVKLAEEYKGAIQLGHIGFPDDWRDGLCW